MNIIVSQESGFCYGVKRALDIVKKTRKERNQKIQTLGPLIHNPGVVKKLNEEGIEVCESIDDLNSGIAIIRTHGISPQSLKEIKNKGIEIIDATCPYVKKSQMIAKRLYEDGYEVVIVGDRNHPEIVGIQGFLNDMGVIVKSEEEAMGLPFKNKKALIAQTTQDENLFERIASILLKNSLELRVFNTICDSTSLRQKSAASIAKEVDVMVVLGGKASSNTNKLYNICKKIRDETYLIENPDELPLNVLKGKKSIGISAGASTPNEDIDALIDKINQLDDQPAKGSFLNGRS
ncbi:MAG: 4-hydroxy-3-methylbut-2-enyl diphosphate reductase [Acidobacteriota bacterium]